jgi:hypothetical protein
MALRRREGCSPSAADCKGMRCKEAWLESWTEVLDAATRCWQLWRLESIAEAQTHSIVRLPWPQLLDTAKV